MTVEPFPRVEPIGSQMKLRAPRGPSKRATDRKLKMLAETTVAPLTPEELREWLRVLGLSAHSVAVLLGRSEACVHFWLSGDNKIPAYVTTWVELLAAFDRMVRAWIPPARRERLVYEFLTAQPGGSGLSPERLAQRMGWPITVVRETMVQLDAEGTLLKHSQG